MTPYTGYPDLQGIIYQDELSKNWLMRTDELHKFSDGTLNHVRTTLNDIATGIQIDYLPERRWSLQDKRRARVMISAIDRKLRDRRLMRSLEKFVGGRPVNPFTMKMEILLEPASNKLIVERFYTSAGNPVKEILLKLNLPDHRILKDGGEGVPSKNTRAVMNMYPSQVSPPRTPGQGGVVRWWCGDDGDDDGDKGGVEMVVMGCGLWAVVVVRGGDDYIDGEVIVVVMMEIGWWWRWCGGCERGHDGDMVVVMAMDLVNWWWGKCRSQRWGGNREGVAAMMVVSGGGRKPVGDDAVNC
ncbi:hypothetical protein Tco_1507467 [Tanacetum coccineum]